MLQRNRRQLRWVLRPANGQDFFGNILFQARAFSKVTNEELYSNWIVAKLKIVKKVAVSNRTIQKNEILSRDDLRWETREIDAFTKDARFLLDNLGKDEEEIIKSFEEKNQ